MKTAVKRSNKSRRERRKESRPSELLAAALELFVARGFAATRLDDVAARAGVSKGTLYLYFTGKNDLFKAVVRGGILPAIVKAEALSGNSPAARVSCCVRSCLECGAMSAAPCFPGFLS